MLGIATTAVKAFGVLGLVRTLLRIPGPAVVEPRCAEPLTETAEMPFVVDGTTARPAQPDMTGA